MKPEIQSMDLIPRLKLATLWTSLMFLYIYADYFELKTPGTLQKMMDLETPVGPATPGLLVIFSVILIIPSLMIFLAIFLRRSWAKWMNLAVGTIWSLISVLIIITNIGEIGDWYSFYLLYQGVELLVFVLILKTAWNWPRPNSL